MFCVVWYSRQIYYFKCRQMHSLSQATLCRRLLACISRHTFPMSARGLTNLRVCWQCVSTWAFKGRRDRQVLSVLSASCGPALVSFNDATCHEAWAGAGRRRHSSSVCHPDWLQPVEKATSGCLSCFPHSCLLAYLPACLPACTAPLPGALLTRQGHAG